MTTDITDWREQVDWERRREIAREAFEDEMEQRAEESRLRDEYGDAEREWQQ